MKSQWIINLLIVIGKSDVMEVPMKSKENFEENCALRTGFLFW